MPQLAPHFELDRCPHCNIHMPQLVSQWSVNSVPDHAGANSRNWNFYKCATCGGFVSAWSRINNSEALEWFPKVATLSVDVPPEVGRFLRQARESVFAPDGAIMLSACAVDAMLKLKGYTQGSLNDRIDEAAKSHLITDDMAAWAHDVRLDANDTRHVDVAAPQPTSDDARRAVSFSETLAEILFVLPARVKRARQDPTGG